MTWLRYGSEHTRDRRWEGVSYEARWHYHAILAECADSERFDCQIPMMLALRASDVPDPEAAIDSLVTAGIALITDIGDLRIAEGERLHMPPPSKRDIWRKSQQRKWTKKHREGEEGSNALHTGPHQAEGEGVHEGVDPESGGIKETDTSSKALHKGLPQNRTEQNRTALRGSIFEEETGRKTDDLLVEPALRSPHVTADVIAEFLPAKAEINS